MENTSRFTGASEFQQRMKFAGSATAGEEKSSLPAKHLIEYFHLPIQNTGKLVWHVE